MAFQQDAYILFEGIDFCWLRLQYINNINILC